MVRESTWNLPNHVAAGNCARSAGYSKFLTGCPTRAGSLFVWLSEMGQVSLESDANKCLHNLMKLIQWQAGKRMNSSNSFKEIAKAMYDVRRRATREMRMVPNG